MKDFLVVIGIPTYKRPQGLRRLLESIAQLEIPAGLKLRVLVADNEGPEGAGMGVVAEMNKLGYALPIGGVGVVERGISQNRNALLQEGFGTLAADALVMVDDDMWLAPEWLREVWAMQQRTGATVISGQMVPIFPADAPKWAPGLGVYQNVRQLQEGLVPLLNATGNVLMLRAVWEFLPRVSFNPVLGLTGGEDADYFLGLQARGCTFAYAPAALSFEEYKGVRLTRKWVMKRAFRIGTGHIHIMQLRNATWLDMLQQFAIAFAQLIIGLLLLPFSWWIPRYQMKTANMIMFSAGKLAGLCHLRVNEYANTLEMPYSESLANKKDLDKLKVVIGIPTFKRPKGLAKLLDSLAKQVAPFTIHVLVADNEGHLGVGLKVVSEYQKNGYRWPITGVSVAERGISFNRNALLEHGFGRMQADFLVMLDDDQSVAEGCLAGFLECQHRTEADVVSCNLMPQFDVPPPAWVHRCGLYYRAIPKDEVVEIASGTGGIMLSRKVYSDFGQQRFDVRFGLSGSEDEDFFKRLKSAGATFAFAHDATVFEHWSQSRVNWRWAVLRTFRVGGTAMSFFRQSNPGIAAWCQELLKINAAALLAVMQMATCWWSVALLMDGLLRLVRQCGKIVSLFNFTYQEYRSVHGA